MTPLHSLLALYRRRHGVALPVASLVFLAFSVVSLASCAVNSGHDASRLPVSTATDPQERAEQARGRDLYARHCAKCHQLYDPGEFHRNEWPRFVKRYGPRAGLDAKQRAEVLGYLSAVAPVSP